MKMISIANLLYLLAVAEAANNGNVTGIGDNTTCVPSEEWFEELELGPQLFTLIICITVTITSLFGIIFMVTMIRVCQESRVLGKLENIMSQLDTNKSTAKEEDNQAY